MSLSARPTRVPQSCWPGVVVLMALATGRIDEAAAQGTVRTIAGGGQPAGVPATSVGVSPTAVAVDAGGNVYLTTRSTHYVFRVDPLGTLTTVTGAASSGQAGDGGPALDALVGGPWGVVTDGAGNIFIAERGNHRVRRVAANGIISTIAGTGVAGYSGDGGPAAAAMLASPHGLAIDHQGNLYIGDVGNGRVRRVSATGTISTVLGTAGTFFNPVGLLVDTVGDLYVTDNSVVRKVAPNGVVSSVAGAAGFSGASGLAMDAARNLFVADRGNHRVRRVTPAGDITTVAGNGTAGFGGDGEMATSASLFSPLGVAVDPAGNLLIADLGNNRVRRVTPGGTISTLAGDGSEAYSGDGGLATAAMIAYPIGVARDAAGHLYVADQHNHRVRKIDANSVITTIVGDGTRASTGDGGPSTSARTISPSSLAVDAAGNVYLGEAHRIRKIGIDGVITAFAGNGTTDYGGDNGPAMSAGFFVAGIAVDAAGNLFIADLANHRIRRVTNGVITTVAGTGVAGSSGDGGPATLAALNSPYDVAVDTTGNLYIADRGNSRVRRVSPDGVITTVAGTGVAGFSGDGGLAVSAMLQRPSSVAIGGSGNLFILDQPSNFQSGARIRRVTPDGVITTVAGSGLDGYLDGAALDARFATPFDLIADAAGNLVVADTANNRVREVVFTHAPVADAGVDQTVEWWSGTGVTPVSLDGSRSSDADGDTLSYEWRDHSGAVVATTASTQLNLPLGTFTFTLTVGDGTTSDSDSVTIVVDDTTPPSTTLTSTAPAVTNSSPIPFQVVFSEPVTGFDATDIVPTNATVTAFTGSGASYSFALIPMAQGTVAVSLSASAAVDGGGNASPFVELTRVHDTGAPGMSFSGLHADSVFPNAWATLEMTAMDANGVAAVSLNGTPATRVGGTVLNGRWRSTVSWSPLGPISFQWAATDFAGNVRTIAVLVDNDGIDQAIDKNATTLADESGVFSSSFVFGQTAGRTSPVVGQMILASVATPTDVSLRGLGSPFSSERMAATLCTGASKRVYLRGNDQAFVRCEGTTLHLTAVSGTITITKHTGTSCQTFQGCTYYYTDYYVPEGSRTSLGSPVTADPSNIDPITVQFVRVTGGLTPPEPDSELFAQAEVYGGFTLEAGESVDIQVVPGDETTPDAVTLSVLSGTVDITVRGETETVNAGATLTGDASPRTDQTITFSPIADRSFGDPSFAATATASSGLTVSFSASGSCTISDAMVTLIGAGACAITASQIGDAAYRPAPSVTRTFQVLHSWSNVLQPVNVDGSSVFRLGSTVPVKFRLTAGSAAVTTLAARITVAHVSNGIVGTEVEAIATGNADAGNVFRYDAQEGQYVFNWGTKGLAEGTWQLRIELLDGAPPRLVVVSLRR